MRERKNEREKEREKEREQERKREREWEERMGRENATYSLRCACDAQRIWRE